MGSVDQLAVAGSAAANGAGSFAVAPDIPVTDVRSKVIGTVQSVRSTAGGKVNEVLVNVGNRTVTLPASNFSGSGNVLVSAMGKNDIKNAANAQ